MQHPIKLQEMCVMLYRKIMTLRKLIVECEFTTRGTVPHNGQNTGMVCEHTNKRLWFLLRLFFIIQSS
ncbi:hypothetical protein HanPI659440_Chr17g0666031 [Helianthus annuus]|nr:hypothetical protein HanPI659440_Chr17g0666031 [Helianthus annuus]